MLVPKVSIVVPIYKVEKEIHRCVESLINQSLTDIEIILVDDGSPDRCPQICDEYVEQDSRIKVIHKENGGLSDARNAGLLKATGEYVLFVDSDDYISSDTCKTLYLSSINEDLCILIADAIRVENNQETIMSHAKSTLHKVLDGQSFLKEQLKSDTMHMAVWLNLYKREFLIENKLYFKKGILHEDEQWTPRVFIEAERVKYINFPFYYYIIRENSITKTKDNTKNGVDLIKTCYELEVIYEKLEDKELKKLLNDYLVMLFLHAINFGNLYSKKYSHIYNKRFLIGKPQSIRNKFKTVLFISNKGIYKLANGIKRI